MEDEQSEKAIKDMGVQQCPKCGANIKKLGGCDHMTCRLFPFTPTLTLTLEPKD